ncbi:secreted protein [Pelolinea submarina]|uniref:Secreted protein n=2 Tax=Pelolinea submarina TaxID=913107 RepID=A0A3E0AGA0_9CHLR|nr:secreted protein [Pelolinea submarina]
MPDMSQKYNRRDFLKTLGTGMAALALPSFLPDERGLGALSQSTMQLGRVARDSISVYSEPSDKSSILFQRFQDDVLNIYNSIVSEDGPAYNPLWYRVWGGYVHSAFVQSVRNRLNTVQDTFPDSGQLMELTVPYSDAYRIRSGGKWEVFYRLYYSSTHWVFGVVEGPDGHPWYEIRDGLVTLSYYVPAAHLRMVTDEELAPISPEVSARDKRIEISIDFQTLKAFENGTLVHEALVSTGLPTTSLDPAAIPTDTPNGTHMVRSKRPSVHMGDGTLRSDAEAYELPGVPWVSYFEIHGYAIHGTYWHNNFGVTMSHGCVNMRSEDAKWVYRWSTPSPQDIDVTTVYHTPVVVTNE